MCVSTHKINRLSALQDIQCSKVIIFGVQKHNMSEKVHYIKIFFFLFSACLIQYKYLVSPNLCVVCLECDSQMKHSNRIMI